MKRGLDIGTDALRVADPPVDDPDVASEPVRVLLVDERTIADSSAISRDSTVSAPSGSGVVTGSAAVSLADSIDAETETLFRDGRIGTESFADAALGSLLEQLLITGESGADPEEVDGVWYTVPGPHVNREGELDTHRQAVESALESIGVEGTPVSKGFAVVYDQLVEDNFTGLGVCIEPQTTSVALAYYGVPVMAFSLERGGDWIVERAAAETGHAREQVASVFEDFALNPSASTGGIESALASAHDALAGELVAAIEANADASDVDRGVAVPVAVAGDRAIEGVEFLFGGRFDAADVPFSIRGVRRADSPAGSAARGALAAAEDGVEGFDAVAWTNAGDGGGTATGVDDGATTSMGESTIAFEEVDGGAVDVGREDDAIEKLFDRLGVRDDEIEAANETIAGLESRTEALSDTLEGLDSKTEVEIETLTDGLDAVGAELADLEGEVEDLELALDAVDSSVEERADSVDERLGSVDERLESVDATLTTLDDATSSLDERTSAFEEEANRLRDELSALQDETTDLRADVEAVDDETATLLDRTETLESRTDSLDDESDALNERIDGLDSAVSSLRSEVDALREPMDALESTVETVETEVSGVRSDLSADVESVESSLHDSLAGIEERTETLANRSESTEATVEDLADAIESIEDRSASEDAVEGLRERLESSVGDVESTIESFEKETATVSGRLEGVSGRLEEMSTRTDRLESEFEETANELTARVDGVEEWVESDLAALRASVDKGGESFRTSIDDAVQSLEAELDDLEDETVREERVDDIAATQERIDMTVERLESAVASLEAELDSVPTGDGSEGVQSNLTAFGDVEAVREAIDRLESSGADPGRVDGLESTIEAVREDVADLKAVVDDDRVGGTSGPDASQSLASIEDEIDDLRTAVDDLEAASDVDSASDGTTTAGSTGDSIRRSNGPESAGEGATVQTTEADATRDRSSTVTGLAAGAGSAGLVAGALLSLDGSEVGLGSVELGVGGLAFGFVLLVLAVVLSRR